MSARTGSQLVLAACLAMHKQLCAAAEKAKRECEEVIEIGSEALAIHNEFREIVNSKEHSVAVIKKLEALKARRARVDRIMKKDALKLMDAQIDAEIERDGLGSEISMLQWKAGRHG